MFILKLIEWFGREKKSGVSMIADDALFGIFVGLLLLAVFVIDKVI